MKKIKVMTVVGTRPEVIRLSRVLVALDRYSEHILVHTGQNYDYELNQIFFDDLGLRKPDYLLSVSGETGAQTIGRVIIEIDKLLAEVKPEAMLVLGDTNSCLSILSAKRRKIPTFHMEAGNRCFDMRVPEEINRRVIDHIADINLTYSSIAKNYLVAEGLPADMIINIGSPMFEVLMFYREKIKKSDIMNRLDLSPKNFFLISAHREENIQSKKNFEKLVTIVNRIAQEYDIPVIVSTHPRTQKRIDNQSSVFQANVKFLKPMSFTDYNKLQIEAKAVLSDSGTINEESSILNFPALNIRETHERPEAMEEAVTIMVGLDVDRVLQALAILDTQPRDNTRLLRQVSDYSVPNVSEKVVRIICSYVDYINRVVWKNY